jgi:hypothetical protein
MGSRDLDKGMDGRQTGNERLGDLRNRWTGRGYGNDE